MNLTNEPDEIGQEIVQNKQMRIAGDAIIQHLKGMPPSAEKTLAIRKFQEGVMWLGMDLKRIHETTGVGANPYPNSKDPTNTIIEPTADGLKL